MCVFVPVFTLLQTLQQYNVGSKSVSLCYFLTLLFKFKDAGTNTRSLNPKSASLGFDSHTKRDGSASCGCVCASGFTFSRVWLGEQLALYEWDQSSLAKSFEVKLSKIQGWRPYGIHSLSFYTAPHKPAHTLPLQAALPTVSRLPGSRCRAQIGKQEANPKGKTGPVTAGEDACVETYLTLCLNSFCFHGPLTQMTAAKDLIITGSLIIKKDLFMISAIILCSELNIMFHLWEIVWNWNVG